jgi:general secretion pathway protein K
VKSRGAALVLVLWLVALLAATIGAFALTAKVEYLQGRVVAQMAAGQETARAGLEYALSRLQADPARPTWHADGRLYRWQFDGRPVELRIVAETGKVDLNLAERPLLEGLLRALAVESARASQLAGAIVDWRDRDELLQPAGGAESGDYAAAGMPYGAKNAPFESIGELQRLLGMDAALYTQLVPLVTVFGNPQPDFRYAAAPVLTAMGLEAAQVIAARERVALAAVDGTSPAQPSSPGNGTYSIDSRVQLGGEREVVLRAVVRAGGSGAGTLGYTVMRWEQGAATR